MAACGTNDTEDAKFSLKRLTPEEKRADLTAMLAEVPFGRSVPDDVFEVATEIGRRAPADCSPQFVAQRWNPDQYRANQFDPSNEQCGRNSPRAPLKQRKSIPVYWLNLSNRRNASGRQIGWSDDIARDKMQEATSWFDTYCIDLDVKRVAVADARVAAMQAMMSAATDGRPYQGEAVTVEAVADSLNHQLYGRELGKPRKYLLVLFTDAFQNVRFGGPTSRVNRVAGNFEGIPVILVPDPPDTASSNIVTHELIHGLGKVLVGQSSFAYLQDIPEFGNPGAEAVTLSRQATWDEGGCPFDMGNAGRGDQDKPMRKPATDNMDWASFWQFSRNGNTRPK